MSDEQFGGSLPTPPYPPLLPAELESVARSEILLNGTAIGFRRGINFVADDDVSITAVDDSINEMVTLTIAGTSRTTGDIKESLQTADHGNWLLCNGGSFSGATFPNLQTLLGGTTLPDLRGRSPMGSGTGPGLTARTLKQTYGEESHIQTLAEIATHTHTQNSHTHTQDSHNHTQNSHNHTQDSHAHFVEDDSGFARAVVNDRALTNFNPSSVGNTEGTVATNQAATATNIAATATNQSATATNQNAGSSTAFNVLHPVYVVNFFIWAG